ncbi:hypothetical protein Tco_0252762 [Tanacetum coccineum]
MFKEDSLKVMRAMLQEQRLSIQLEMQKRVKDYEWFKDKMLLAQAQEAGVMLLKVKSLCFPSLVSFSIFGADGNLHIANGNVY